MTIAGTMAALASIQKASDRMHKSIARLARELESIQPAKAAKRATAERQKRKNAKVIKPAKAEKQPARRPARAKPEKPVVPVRARKKREAVPVEPVKAAEPKPKRKRPVKPAPALPVQAPVIMTPLPVTPPKRANKLANLTERLEDIELVILMGGINRADRIILPLPSHIADRHHSVVKSLMDKGLVKEIPAERSQPKWVHPTPDGGWGTTLVVTDKAFDALGITAPAAVIPPPLGELRLADVSARKMASQSPSA